MKQTTMQDSKQSLKNIWPAVMLALMLCDEREWLGESSNID